jgi:hypothetical protein
MVCNAPMGEDAMNLPTDLDGLLRVVADDPDPSRASAAAAAAMRRSGYFERWRRWEELALPEELTADQRRVAVALLRDDVRGGGHGLPSSVRLLRRWLGVDPPGVLERRVPWTHEGVAVDWPLWKVWRESPEEALEHNQGIPLALMERLGPAELIEAAAESLLEPYGIQGYPLEQRLHDILAAHGASAATWAASFADLLASIRSPDGPRARDDARGYGMLGLYQWDALGLITMLPLVKAGVALDPRWDAIAPFSGDALGREVLGALPPDRREALVYRRLMTDWGASGAKALNGFDTGFPLLDLVPSERVTRVLMDKLRNNRGYFKKRVDRLRARFDELAAEHPGVAAGLKPRRAARTK